MRQNLIRVSGNQRSNSNRMMSRKAVHGSFAYALSVVALMLPSSARAQPKKSNVIDFRKKGDRLVNTCVELAAK
jgi:hypothetical protein